MKSLVIRQATINDAVDIQAVLTASHWFTYEHLFPREYIQSLIKQYYQLDRVIEEIKHIDALWHGYTVAELNHTIIGVIGGGMINHQTAEVYVFYLEPTMRSKGVGTRLLETFTKIQKYQYGAVGQWVAVAKGNQYGIPFYESKGFIFQHEEQSYDTTPSDNDISLKYYRKI